MSCSALPVLQRVSTFPVFSDDSPLDQDEDKRSDKRPQKVEGNQGENEFVDVAFSGSLMEYRQKTHEEQEESRELVEREKAKQREQLKKCTETSLLWLHRIQFHWYILQVNSASFLRRFPSSDRGRSTTTVVVAATADALRTSRLHGRVS